MEVLQQSPLNAQPRPHELIKHFTTPIDGIFARNHGDIPEIHEHSYRLKLVVAPSVCEGLSALTGLNCRPIIKELSLHDIKSVWNQNRTIAALEVNMVRHPSRPYTQNFSVLVTVDLR